MSLVTINSSMSGTFYRASSHGQPPFVEIGRKISKGDVVCVIESMKLFNEIESEVTGTVIELLVGDATTVEYGQPLFRVNTSSQLQRASTFESIAPNAPLPIASGLVDHQELEFDPTDTSGIKTLLGSEQGYIVGRLGNELLRLNTDAHLLTISPTGGGKGTGLIIPNLLHHPGSVFVVDIRGETLARTATARRLQGHKVIVIDPFEITEGQWGRDSYNPFDRITNDLDSRSLDDRIQRLTQALMFDPSGRMSNEPIWDNATKQLLSGLITLCVRYWQPYRHNLVEILDVLNYSAPELERLIDEIKVIIDNDPRGKNDRQLKGLLKILTESKTTTKITDNALVQARTLLAWAGNKSFEGIIEDSTFSFDELQNGNLTVYLVVPEEFIDNCAIWVRLMLESAVFSLKDIYSSKGISTSQLTQEQRVLFLLDELPAFGQLDIVSSGMATLRGRGVNLWLFIQNLAQLDSTYGKEKARTIIGNAACLQVFGSNELEELEYFSRLIGEEFYDVQSVTISETETKGTSVAEGKSNTVSNSQSVTETKGTADTFSEAKSISWSDSFGRSTNKTRSTNQNRSSGGGTSSGTSWNINQGGGKTFKRNLLWSTPISDNSSSGTGFGMNSGNSQNWQESSGTGESVGEGRSYTNTKGGSETTTTSHTDSQSTSIGTQKGYSDTTSETHTKQKSRSVGRSITVKQERMKIETVRSLREKLSGRNQLLQIRGHHPFFAPRMSYFVKFIGADRYMFPDMASLADAKAFSTISSRKELITPFLDHLRDIKPELEFIEEMKNRLSGNKDSSNPASLMEACKSILDSNHPMRLVEKSREVEKRITAQRQAFDEITIAALGFISIFKKLEFDNFFSDAGEKLVEEMQHLEELMQDVSAFMPDFLDRYQYLPLTTVRENTQDGYHLSTDDQDWIVELYSPIVKNLLTKIEALADQLRLKAEEHEEMRNWLVDALRFSHSSVDSALEIAIEKENQWKHDFFMKRNGLI